MIPHSNALFIEPSRNRPSFPFLWEFPAEIPNSEPVLVLVRMILHRKLAVLRLWPPATVACSGWKLNEGAGWMGFERSKLGKKGHTPNLETNTWKLSVKVMTIKKTKKQELFCKQNTIHRERERAILNTFTTTCAFTHPAGGLRWFLKRSSWTPVPVLVALLPGLDLFLAGSVRDLQRCPVWT